MKIEPIVRYHDQIVPVPCPYGHVRRIITGGEGTANVHVVRVTKGGEHFHLAYDETYYFLSGKGALTIDKKTFPVKLGTVAVIPAGMVHSVLSDSDDPLEFIVFGTPPMPIDDYKAIPQKPQKKW